MKPILMIISLVTLISCSVRNANGSVTSEDGSTFYSHASPQFRIRLYNDYNFHSLNKKYFPDGTKGFLKYTNTKINGLKPELMYAAHTVVQPYYSSVGILYKNARVDSLLLNSIKSDMKSRLATAFRSVDTVETTYGIATRFAYQVLDPVTKIQSFHWEYLLNCNGSLLRFFFWTTNSDTSIISHEIQSIIKDVRQ